MFYRKIYLCLFLMLTSCVTSDTLYNKQELSKKNFVNKGFAIVYSQDLYNEKKISKKMDSREMVVFQKNLKKGTIVRIKNILNDKTIIAKVGSKSEYPLFNNVVITERISNEIDLDLNEPYGEVYEVLQNSTFIAKKAKTYAKEKEVADKAPVLPSSKVDASARGISATIPEKIIKEIPFPTPLKVICSPSQSRKIVPPIIVIIVLILKKIPGSITAEPKGPPIFSRPTDNP